MKRYFLWILTITLCLTLCACAEGGSGDTEAPTDGFDVSAFDEVERDSSGRVIRTVKTTDEGTEETFYDAQGKPASQILLRNDGTRREVTYGDEGYAIRVVTVLDDVTIESYSRSATCLEKEIRTYADGSVRTDYYDESNRMTHSEQTQADGTRVETSYYPSCGKHIETTHRTDGSVDVTHFDEDGNILSSTLTEADGTKTEWSFEYHDGGEVKVETVVHDDGMVVELHFREDGTQEKRVVIENGVRTEYPCDEQGNELSVE